jgi:hypothetical protein
MHIGVPKPKKTLNKAFLKVKPNLPDIYQLYELTEEDIGIVEGGWCEIK